MHSFSYNQQVSINSIRVDFYKGNEQTLDIVDKRTGAKHCRVTLIGEMMGEKKLDRRRRYTLAVIREAFFALLAEVGFAKMTVADICRRADINRGTFYLHYEDKFALLDALIDEALEAASPLEGTESVSLCQRPPADDDYRLLYSDSDAYARVAQRVIDRGAEQMVPWVMEKTGLSREDAFLLFVHNVQGNLAVNRLLGWSRGPEFAHAQELLNVYSEGGLQALSALRDARGTSCPLGQNENSTS